MGEAEGEAEEGQERRGAKGGEGGRRRREGKGRGAGGLTHPVGRIDICLQFEQELHRVELVRFGCHVQGGVAVLSNGQSRGGMMMRRGQHR